MIKAILVGMLVVSIGCAGAPVVVIQGIQDKNFRVEENPLPERPDKEAIPDGQNTVTPLLKGQTAPTDGLLFSEKKAARALKYQAGYNEIRSLYELDREIWKQNRTIYEERIGQANAHIKSITPSFWDLQKGTLGFIGGMILGALVTVGIAVGVHQTQ